MRARILIGILILSLVCPCASHAFGLLRYTFDGIANQLGLDRGPIQKIPPKVPPSGFLPHGYPPNAYPDANRIHIQAEGF